MSAESGRYVLDSYALLAFLQGETGMARIKAVLKAAEQETCRVYLSWINLGEVLDITERAKGLQRTREVLARILALPIEMLEATSQAVLDAAHIKATHRLAHVDAFAVVAAVEKNATILTADPEFATVENMIRVEWLIET